MRQDVFMKSAPRTCSHVGVISVWRCLRFVTEFITVMMGVMKNVWDQSREWGMCFNAVRSTGYTYIWQVTNHPDRGSRGLAWNGRGAALKSPRDQNFVLVLLCSHFLWSKLHVLSYVCHSSWSLRAIVAKQGLKSHIFFLSWFFICLWRHQRTKTNVYVCLENMYGMEM